MITRNTDYSIQRLRGLSTDTKPTDVPNGSEFREMDTGKKFLYSAAGTEWIEQQGSGGGSGGGGSNSMKVIFTGGQSPTAMSADKTFSEIFNAINNNSYVFGVKASGPNNAYTVYYVANYSDNGIIFRSVTVGQNAVTQSDIAIGQDNRAVLTLTFCQGVEG